MSKVLTFGPERLKATPRGPVATTVGVLLLTLGLSGTLTTPASASGTYHGGAYVTASTKTDSMGHNVSWGDEGVVNLSKNTHSNATCLWQKILWADGLLAASGIDGHFGPNTAYATNKWQQRNGLAADSSAGRQSWGTAGLALVDTNGDGHTDTYDGAVRDFAFMVTSGIQYFHDGKGVKRAASYNSNTCS
ncbi:peptidoglycan-binding protein [Streptomyces sp. NPDC013181]|uniref:peptidoglycan-binding domain-containing protein n=1 Tax=unclassified Streptomyces TaxID=2593676 RepID=UPI0036B0D55C